MNAAFNTYGMYIYLLLAFVRYKFICEYICKAAQIIRINKNMFSREKQLTSILRKMDLPSSSTYDAICWCDKFKYNINALIVFFTRTYLNNK